MRVRGGASSTSTSGSASMDIGRSSLDREHVEETPVGQASAHLFALEFQAALGIGIVLAGPVLPAGLGNDRFHVEERELGDVFGGGEEGHGQPATGSILRERISRNIRERRSGIDSPSLAMMHDSSG